MFLFAIPYKTQFTYLSAMAFMRADIVQEVVSTLKPFPFIHTKCWDIEVNNEEALQVGFTVCASVYKITNGVINVIFY